MYHSEPFSPVVYSLLTERGVLTVHPRGCCRSSTPFVVAFPSKAVKADTKKNETFRPGSTACPSTPLGAERQDIRPRTECFPVFIQATAEASVGRRAPCSESDVMPVPNEYYLALAPSYVVSKAKLRWGRGAWASIQPPSMEKVS